MEQNIIFIFYRINVNIPEGKLVAYPFGILDLQLLITPLVS
jgi:hypothetical protein